MKRNILMILALISSQTFAAEVNFNKEEIKVNSNEVTLIRNVKSPKQLLLTLEHKSIDRSRRGECLEYKTTTVNGEHSSCDPISYEVEYCKQEKECSVEALPNCTVTAGQDCKVKVCRSWTSCQMNTRSRVGTCDYEVKSCIRYKYPSIKKLISIFIKFKKSSLLSNEQEELLKVSFETTNNSSTPIWDIDFLNPVTKYEIKKKKASRLLPWKKAYYQISKD